MPAKCIKENVSGTGTDIINDRDNVNASRTMVKSTIMCGEPARPPRFDASAHSCSLLGYSVSSKSTCTDRCIMFFAAGMHIEITHLTNNNSIGNSTNSIAMCSSIQVV